MVIMMIGVLAVLSLLVTARHDAESASDRAAIALAARQMLENHMAGWGPALPSDQVVPVGVRHVRVTLTAESASAGLFRLRSRARDEASGSSWILEMLEVRP
jgi:Tfp pilus assembly protein PilV